ncbi:39S ribosomal protein L28, mitochondrial [Armadillidium vulgare]|nr:39S ribosomal protein L28, mitochondrial [Armadillidium vulgare]
MTHHFKVIQRNLPPSFLRKTLHRPWMRLFIFLDDGPLSRTPEHYKKFIYDWKVATPSPVHYIPEDGLWKKEENGEMEIHNHPLPLKYPIEMHEGLWGGDAIIKGLIQKETKKDRRRIIFSFLHFHKKKFRYHPIPIKNPYEIDEGPWPFDGVVKEVAPHYYRFYDDPTGNFWIPRLIETIVYSEILNRYVKTIVTYRALEMIDKHYGLDPYILKTPPCDLYTEMALKMKREMLYALHDKSLYPDDPEKREEIYNKYKEHLIPEEEIEWFGLNLREAYRKQMKLEEASAKIGPYKHIFRKEFIEQLKLNELKKVEETEAEKK